MNLKAEFKTLFQIQKLHLVENCNDHRPSCWVKTVPKCKIEHKKKTSIQLRTCRTYEEVEKGLSEEHPYNQTRSSVKISFQNVFTFPRLSGAETHVC